MRSSDILNYALNSLRHRKTRTFLTLLGIIVGISSVIILVGLVQGLKQDILMELESFGPRTIIITPTSTSGGAGIGGSAFAPTTGKLFEKDFERVKRLPEIKTITKVISGSTSVSYKENDINSQVFGIDPEVFTDTLDLEVESGRFLVSSDRGVAVVGSRVSESFDEPIKTQANIELDGKKFKVVGVLKPTGSAFGPVDNVIFIPFDDAQLIFSGNLLPGEISAIRMTLKEGSDVDAAAEQIEDIMIASHRVTEDEKDFGVISPTFINRQFTGILDILSIFLGAIASISLIVGGIGISNTMFMSVLERTKEIGTMKAVGGTQAQIRNMFLAESCLLGLGGGLIGIILAIAVGLFVTAAFQITFAFDPAVTLGSLAFSVLIGAISGTFPAINAAKVDPIVALRYE
jgi:putative ABC transport system permease protein